MIRKEEADLKEDNAIITISFGTYEAVLTKEMVHEEVKKWLESETK